MAFEWASTYCNFSFLLKMDDDTFVNVKRLISVLAKPEIPKEKLYVGHCFKGLSLKGEENGKFRMKIIIKHSTQTSVLDTELSCLLMLFICSWIYMPLFPGLKLTMFTSVCLRKRQV